MIKDEEVLIESMACGIPIITSDVGGISEHIDNSKGMIIQPKDTDSLVKCMKEMILNSGSYDNLVIRKYAVDNFSNSAVADQFDELYTCAIENL